MDSWILEYITIVLAIAAFGCIIAVLALYNGKPTTDWGYTISLNAVLSTLSTVMKGAILLPVGSALSQLKWCWYHRKQQPLQRFAAFDAASRGPLGAVTLLYELRFWHIASLGSAVTLLALANDVFVQQSVAYPLRNAVGVATLPIAQSYALAGRYMGNSAQAFEQSMLGAIYDGIFYSNISTTAAAITAQCAAGNCEFPDYASLGICSYCEDTTSLIEPVCTPTVYAGVPANCSMSARLPNGLDLANGNGYAFYTGRFNYLNMSTSSPLNINPPLSAQSLVNISMLLSDVEVALPQNYSEMYNKTIAYDCILYFCVRKYSASVTSGVLSETPISEFVPSNERYDEIFDGLRDTKSWNITIPADMVPQDSDLTFIIGNLTSNTNLDFRTNLYSLLHGTGTGNNQDGLQSFSSDLVEGMFLKGARNIPSTIGDLATSMTNNMRLRAGQLVQGQSITSVPYIHVRWPWLVLPIVVLVAAVMFLLLTIWESHRRAMPLWKSSALAVLLHNLQRIEGEGQYALVDGEVGRGHAKVSELEKQTRNISVELKRVTHHEPNRIQEVDHQDNTHCTF